MSEDKVKVILDWSTTRKVKNIQSFLGLANFYCRFIPYYSDIVILLTRLTWKNTLSKWTSQCQEAFDSLKKAFTSALTLAQWKPGALLIVETDASDYALATILSMVTNDGVHLLVFLSWTFTAPELNYNVHNKELLAIYEAFCTWCHGLDSGPTPDIPQTFASPDLQSSGRVMTQHGWVMMSLVMGS